MADARKLLTPSTRYFPFYRDDSQHMVYGPATSESVDSYGTVFALDATREALAEYEQWRTLRAMHEHIAAGTVPVLEIDDTALHIGARVVDPGEWQKVVSGVYRGFSIGFDPMDGRWEMRDGQEVFLFSKYRLIEISLVDRPSNPDCTFTLFRAESTYKLAPKDAGWTWDWKTDADRILAKGGQKLLAQACAWYDKSASDDDGDGYPDAKGAYKLPVAKLAKEDDDKLTLYYYGVTAAMAALNGARKGVSIPEDQREGVYKKLATLYRLFDETPPEFKRRAKEDSMNQDELSTAVEKGVLAFFRRLLPGGKESGEPPIQAPPIQAPAPSAKIRMAPAALERLNAVAEALKADITAESPVQVRAAAEALEALIGVAEAEAPAAPPAPSDIEKRLKALEDENQALKANLNQALAARKSQETVQGSAPFRSRYNGAFFA
jgi:phage head maturation protease